MKRILASALALSLALAPAVSLAEGEDIRVYLDGKRLELTDADGNAVTPVVIDGTAYLPVRAISEALELGVSWNGDTRSVYLSSDGNTGVIATDLSAYSELEHFVDNPYELLGTEAFISPIKELAGPDYETLLLPSLSTCYASGNSEMLTLYGSSAGNNVSAIDIYKNGRIDIAILAAVKNENSDSDEGEYRNVVKYYSTVLPDAIDSPGLIKFIASNIKSHNVIEFCRGKGAPVLGKSTYVDVNGYGSFSFTPKGEDNSLSFNGGITGSPNGSCTSNGTVNLKYGCTVCMENDAPSILFAFSGDSLTVIGLNNVTKALTTVYKK